MAAASLEPHANQLGEWNESTHRTFLDIHATLFGTLGISLAALECARVPKPEEIAPLEDESITIGAQVYRRFPFAVNAQGDVTERMSSDTVASFHKAGASAVKTLAANLAAERAVLAKVMATVSPSMRQAFDNLAGSTAALATHDPYNQSSLKTLLVFACATALLCRSPSNHGAWIPRADSQPRIVSTNQQKIRKIDGRCRLRLRRGCRAAAGVRPGLLGVIASSTT